MTATTNSSSPCLSSAISTFTPNGNGNALLSIGAASRLTGLSVSHLRKLANRGAIPTFTTATGGHRRFRRESLAAFLGVDGDSLTYGSKQGSVCGGDNGDNLPANRVALLARVSSDKQGKGWDTSGGARKVGSDNESDLERQVNQLRGYCRGKYGVEGSLYSDIGSGLNYNRKNFVHLLEEVCRGNWKGGTVVVSHKDRAMRYGWELWEVVCREHGVALDVIDRQTEVSDDQELADDVLSILTHFSAKKHGRRAAKANSLNLTPEGLERLGELRRAGYNIRTCTGQLKREGFFATNGRGEAHPVTCWVVAKVLSLEAGKVVEAYAGEGVEEEKTSIEEWGSVHLEPSDNPADKLSSKAIRKAYASYCASRGETPVSVVTIGLYLKQRGFKKYEVAGRAWFRGVKMV